METSLKVIVQGTKVIAELTGVLTSGMVGVPVEFQFDEDWGDLRKIGVFEGSGQKKFLDLNLGVEQTIPWEVLLEDRTMVKVGVEGRNADGTVVIPTRWAEVGVVLSGAQAGNDPAMEPTPTVYDQIMRAIDDGRLQGEPGIPGEPGAPGKDAETGASPIVCEAEGETILLTDSGKQKLRGLKLYGKSEQFTTTGVQLLQLDDATKSSNGISAVVKNGAVAISGTATDGTSVIVLKGKYDGAEDVIGLPSGDYKLTGDYLHVQIRKADGTTRNTSSAYSLTLADGEYIVCVFLYISKGTAVNTTVYPMISAGTTALAYEPYTGGKPSPSPEYPQEIVSAGADGDIGVTVCGANLMPLTYTTYENGGITIVFNGNTATAKGTNTAGKQINTNGRVSIPLPIVKGNYFFTPSSNGVGIRLQIQNADGTEDYPTGNYSLDGTEKRANLYLEVNAGVTVDTTINLMVNKGDTLLPFEPYKEPQTLTALTPNGLPGIKVKSGGNYTDSPGQQWVSDEIDSACGEYVQRVYHATEKDFSITTWSNGAICLVANNVPAPNPDYSVALCSISGSYAYHWDVLSTAHHFVQKNNQKLVVVLPNTYTTVERAQIILDSGFDFVYPLLEPIRRPLSEEKLAQFAELQTYYPTTTILNDEGVGMEVSYVADTKNYIDKKFTELAAAIIANA